MLTLHSTINRIFLLCLGRAGGSHSTLYRPNIIFRTPPGRGRKGFFLTVPHGGNTKYFLDRVRVCLHPVADKKLNRKIRFSERNSGCWPLPAELAQRNNNFPPRLRPRGKGRCCFAKKKKTLCQKTSESCNQKYTLTFCNIHIEKKNKAFTLRE